MQKGTFPKSTFLRKGGLALCLAAATSMAIGPTVAYAGQTYTENAISPTALTAGLLEIGEEGYEYDISMSETVSVTGADGNVYTGEALDPIFMYDSANSSLNEYSKSTERPGDGGMFFSAYLVEYENNVNAGTATYKITGGKTLGAYDWASKYVGTLTGTFEIAKADLSQAKAVALADGEKGVYLATGEAITPKLKVALRSHQEYVGYDPETYEGIYEDVPDYMKTDDDWSYVYRDADGKVVDEVKTAGNYTVEAVAKSENVTGATEAVPFTVTDEAIPITDAVIGDIADQAATSSAVEPDLTVTLGDTTLEKDVDYTVEYSDNVNVGTATATVTGKGIYQGTVSKTFKIVPGDISGAEIVVENMATYNTLPYTGSEQKPKASVVLRQGGHYDSDWNYVYDVEVELKEGVDYELSYANTKDVWKAENICDENEKGDAHETLYPADKQPTISVKGIGNFGGTAEMKFSIVPAVDISGAIVRDLENLTYNGKAQAIAPKDAGTSYINLLPKYNICSYGLKDAEGVAYTVSYKDADGNEIAAEDVVNAGTYTMVLTGLESGGFYGTKEVNFAISQADFANVEVDDIADQAVGFDGSDPEPIPRATFTSGEGDSAVTVDLVAGEDFDVTYNVSQEDGIGRATLAPKGNFAGEAKSVNFKVVAAEDAGEATMNVPVNWTSTDGRDYNKAMKRSVTDTVNVAKNADGTYAITFKAAAGGMIDKIEYPLGTENKPAEDGTFTLVTDSIDEPLLMFVSVPPSPTKGYTTNMMLDLDNAEYALEDNAIYTTDLAWKKADGSASMVQAYIPTAKVMKTYNGYQVALGLTDEAAGMITGVNGTTEAPYVLDLGELEDGTEVTFDINTPVGAMTQTAYMNLSLADDLEEQAASAGEKAEKALTDAIEAAKAIDTSKLTDEQKKALEDAIAAAEDAAAGDEITPAAANAAAQAIAAAAETANDAIEAAEAAEAAQKANAALSDAIAEAEKIDTSKLTNEQKTALEAAIAAAKEAAAAEGANAASLQEAIDALQSAAGTAKDAVAAAEKAATDEAAAGKAAAEKAAKKAAAAEAKAKKVKSVTVNVKNVTAKAVKKAISKKGGKLKYVTKVTLGKKAKTIKANAFKGMTALKQVVLGKNVKKLSKKAFKGAKRLKTLIVKTKKLTKKSVKGSLKGSKVKTVKVPKAKKKAYKKIFKKANSGKKVAVK